MRRPSSGGCCVRDRHRRYGRADVSDSKVAAAHDLFWRQPADPGSGLPEAAPGEMEVLIFFFCVDEPPVFCMSGTWMSIPQYNCRSSTNPLPFERPLPVYRGWSSLMRNSWTSAFSVGVTTLDRSRESGRKRLSPSSAR